jgi:hypothetical protein
MSLHSHHRQQVLVTSPKRLRRIFRAHVFIGDNSLVVNVYGFPLFSDGAGQRLLRLASRPQRQVIAHHIDNHGRKHQKQCDPEFPIMMRAFPVRTMALMNMVVILLAGMAVTALILTHGLPAFSIPSPMISGRRCYCSLRFHRGVIFATARRPVAPGAMKQSLLCRQHMGLLASPNLQRRLLDGAGKRKCQRPRQS